MTPSLAQPPDQRPHVAAQVDVDAGGRLVEKQHVGLVAQRLGDHHPPFHAARQFDDLGVALVPQRKIAQQPLDIGRIRRPPEQPAAVADRVQDGGENIERDLLRHEADDPPRGAIVAHDIMAVDEDPARSHRHRAADDADQRRLAGAVRAEEGENLAFGDLEVDRVEGDQARLIALGYGGDGYHRRHRRSSPIGALDRRARAGRRRGEAREPRAANAASPTCRRKGAARHPPASGLRGKRFKTAERRRRSERSLNVVPRPNGGRRRITFEKTPSEIRNPSARRSSRPRTGSRRRRPDRRSNNLHPGLAGLVRRECAGHIRRPSKSRREIRWTWSGRR